LNDAFCQILIRVATQQSGYGPLPIAHRFETLLLPWYKSVEVFWYFVLAERFVNNLEQLDFAGWVVDYEALMIFIRGELLR
jgi:hypothetical protein